MVPVREPKTYSVMLADELTLVREGLAALCRTLPQYRVVDQCSDGASALRTIMTNRPDIAVLDLNLPDLFSLAMVRKLREAQIATRIVVLSTRKDRKTVVEALRAGVNAFLLKSGPAHHLLEAFEQILDEQALGFDQLVDFILDGAATDELVHEDVAELADAEGAVGRLILDGGVPPPVEVDDMRRGGEIEAGATGFEGQDEERRQVVFLELAHQLLTLCYWRTPV